MNERLKAIRLSLNLSQEEFGSNIGIKSRAHISALESGARNITDRIISDVCREYSVREEWLRSGTGDTFQSGQVPASALSEVAQEYNLDAVDVALITEYMKLDAMYRNALKNKIREIFLADEASDPISEAPSTPEELEKKYPPINPHEDHEDVG